VRPSYHLALQLLAVAWRLAGGWPHVGIVAGGEMTLYVASIRLRQPHGPALASCSAPLPTFTAAAVRLKLRRRRIKYASVAAVRIGWRGKCIFLGQLWRNHDLWRWPVAMRRGTTGRESILLMTGGV